MSFIVYLIPREAMQRSKRCRSDAECHPTVLIKDLREPFASGVFSFLSPSSLGAVRSACRTFRRWFDYSVYLETSLPAVGTRKLEGFIFQPASCECEDGSYFPLSHAGLIRNKESSDSSSTIQIGVMLNLRYFTDDKGKCMLAWCQPHTYDSGLISELLVVGSSCVREVGDRFLCDLQGLSRIQFQGVDKIERIGDHFLARLGLGDVDLSPFRSLAFIGSNFLSSTYGLSRLNVALPTLEVLGDACLKYSAVQSVELHFDSLRAVGCDWMRFCPELRHVSLSAPHLEKVGAEWLVQCDLLKKDVASVLNDLPKLEDRLHHLRRLSKV